MEDYYEEDDYDDVWLEVEEGVGIVDELAETSVPSPGYAGTNFELNTDDIYDVHLMSYWDELEYLSDSHYDRPLSPSHQPSSKPDNPSSRPHKRRRINPPSLTPSSTALQSDPVLFLPHTQRPRSRVKASSPPTPTSPFALLPDWRQRLSHATGLPSKATVMPASMRVAAEAHQASASDDEDEEYDGDRGDEEDGEWEDDEEGADGGMKEVGAAEIDVETLQAVLRERLKDAGLGSGDEEAFMRTMMGMLNGDGGEDGMGELAGMLLGKLGSGNGGTEGLEGWLGRQGVDVDGDGDEEDEQEEDDVEGDGGDALGARVEFDRRSKASRASRQDSAVGMHDDVGDGRRARRGVSNKTAVKAQSSVMAERNALVDGEHAQQQTSSKRKRGLTGSNDVIESRDKRSRK